jgi:hypothetical protein
LGWLDFLNDRERMVFVPAERHPRTHPVEVEPLVLAATRANRNSELLSTVVHEVCDPKHDDRLIQLTSFQHKLSFHARL